MDEYAFRSHSRASAAHQNGLFKAEIVSGQLEDRGSLRSLQLPIEALQHTAETAESKDPKQRKKVLVQADDGLRPTTMEGLQKARPAFPQWKPAQTTGGNASQLTDGAAVCLLMSRAKAEASGAKILAKHVATCVTGLAPRIMYALQDACEYDLTPYTGVQDLSLPSRRYSNGAVSTSRMWTSSRCARRFSPCTVSCLPD
jgi:acetyl-CoA acyltransferase 1